MRINFFNTRLFLEIFEMRFCDYSLWYQFTNWLENIGAIRFTPEDENGKKCVLAISLSFVGILICPSDLSVKTNLYFPE